MATSSWTGRSKGTPLGYRIFILVMRTLGVRAAYGLLVFVAPWYVLTSRSSNAALRSYFTKLRAQMPGTKGLSLFASYRAFGRTIIDKVAVRAGLQDRYQWETCGREHVQAMLSSAQGGLLISAHVGNWELASHVLHGMPGRMSVVLQDAEDERIRRVVEDSTGPGKFDVIPLSSDLSHIFRMHAALHEGRVLCMHGDRSLPGARTRRAAFLGVEADFPAGPFALAAAQQVPVCIAFVVRTGPFRYSFWSTPPSPAGSSADEVFARFVAELERVVKEHPLQWFNYYDFWGHAKSTGQR